jgi:hypothetical protein
MNEQRLQEIRATLIALNLEIVTLLEVESRHLDRLEHSLASALVCVESMIHDLKEATISS